jgi:hypothetical protein
VTNSQKPKPSKKIGVTTYLSLSAIAAAVVGAIVWGGVRRVEETLLWAGITFIVALVGIATLALTVKDTDQDPNQPRLK